MDKKILATVGIFSLIILIFGYIVFGSQNKKNNEIKIPSKNEIVYYYGATCPHCKEVEEWIEKNKIKEKIKIEEKEVWENKDNALQLKKVAENCQLNSETIGVPFLYAEGKCFMGTPEVIKFLKNKLKIKN